jgi:3-phosphoshikimate 1-carboxyvinyltransferase
VVIELRPSGPLRARVLAPPSKSATLRALVAAALARGASVVHRPLPCDDTDAMVRGLRHLGVAIERNSTKYTFPARPPGRKSVRSTVPLRGTIDCGAAGAVIRFLAAVAALGRGEVVLDGEARLRERPIGPLADALRALGAEVAWEGATGFPPLRVRARGLRGGSVTLDASASSQFLSALLLAGPCMDADLEVRVVGPLASAPYVELTAEVMAAFGATVERPEPGLFRVPRTGYRGADFAVEGDWSAAAFLLAAAAIAGGSVTVEGLRADSRQGDRAIAGLLERMGCAVARGADGITARGGPLRAIDADLGATPDLAPALAAVAAFASGTTRVRGVAHLRLKESDRIASIVRALGALGIAARERADGFEVDGGSPRAGEIDPAGDHRIAMAFALAGLAAPGVRVRNRECVAKSWPEYFAVVTTLKRASGPETGPEAT